MAGCFNLTAPVWQHLTTMSTSLAYKPYTEWRQCTGLDAVQAVLKVKGAQGNIQVKFAIQVAAVRTNNPGNWTPLGSFQVGAGEAPTAVIDITAYTGGALYIRFGVAYSLTSGSALGEADVGMQAAYDVCGEVLGVSTFDLGTNTTSIQYRAASRWIPAIQAAKMKAGFIQSGLTGTLFQSRMCMRTAPTSTEVASAWSLLEAGWHAANGELNTGELTITTTDFFVQFGIAFSLSSGSTWASATVSTAVAVRRS